MSLETTNLNTPVWNTLQINKHSAKKNTPALQPALPVSFQEMWYFNLHDPVSRQAMSIRFTILISGNGFRRISEVWAIHFQKSPDQETLKLAVRQKYDIASFRFSPETGIVIGDCEFNETRTRGKLQSKGHTLSWDLNLAPRLGFEDKSYELVPASLKKTGLAKNSVITAHTGLSFSGTTEIDGKQITWNHSPGMQGHQSGSKYGHSWSWGHCNSFVNERGDPAAFVFEGLSARARLFGQVPSLRISSFYFQYQGRSYYFNSLSDVLRLRSSNTLNEWRFQADRNDLSFRGTLKAEHKDFAGLTQEDTDGSLIYCSNTNLASAEIQVYRAGKLETALSADHSAAFEIASRERNPYIPQLA